MARRSSRQKLIGWAVFAAMLLVIVAIFAVTRMLGGAPQASSGAASSVAEALPSAADAPGAVSRAPGSASSASASAETSTASSAASAASPAEAITPDVEVIDAETMTQQSRKGLLLTLIQQGVLTGVQAVGTPPRVGVTALFQGLSSNLQRQFIAVVYAYINNGGTGTQTLQLIDATSGSQVGSYSASDGLKLGQG